MYYIFLDDDHIWMCKKTETKFGNSDHLLKLNPRMLDNPFISKEIVANFRDKESASDWDFYK
ncbi:11331_t:CDS:2, partial [Gigaspora rosea]